MPQWKIPVFAMFFVASLFGQAVSQTLLDDRLTRVFAYLDSAISGLKSASANASAYTGPPDVKSSVLRLAELIDQVIARKELLGPTLREYVAAAESLKPTKELAELWNDVRILEGSIGTNLARVWGELRYAKDLDRIIGEGNRSTLGQLLYKKGEIRVALSFDSPPRKTLELKQFRRLADKNDEMVQLLIALSVEFRKIANRS
jgi:hypothetical protein